VPVDRGALRPGDLAVWDGHVAMIVGNGTMIEPRCQLGVQNDRRHGIASAHFICPSKPSDVAMAR
jgi:cell wall-associated NlpC family hydrolase